MMRATGQKIVGMGAHVQAMEQSVQGWEGGSREEVSVCERGG